MQSILTFLLAETIEHKKETIALIINRVTDKITNTHHKHVALIEHKINNTISFLKGVSKKSAQQDDSKTNTTFSFPIICENITHFKFTNNKRFTSQKFFISNDNIHLLLWVKHQPHPPKL
jgi:hypothetical protein